MAAVEPTDALRSIETALRLVIADVLGSEAWLTAPGAPAKERLEERRAEEHRRRDGAVPSTRLLDYTETYHLTTIIEKNWEKFKPAFNDKRRTEAFFGIVNDVRNSVAHSRDLVPFERDLISGIAGHFRHQVSLFRSSRNPSSRYYPLIESVHDQFGRDGDDPHSGMTRGPRLDVGGELIFTGTAFNSRKSTVQWQLLRTAQRSVRAEMNGTPLAEARGDSVSLRYTLTEAEVSEDFGVLVRIRTTSPYCRHNDYYESYDDQRIFLYPVNPPDDE